jgi:hypothetical protein
MISEAIFCPLHICPACKECDDWLLVDSHGRLKLEWICGYCNHRIVAKYSMKILKGGLK